MHSAVEFLRLPIIKSAMSCFSYNKWKTRKFEMEGSQTNVESKAKKTLPLQQDDCKGRARIFLREKRNNRIFLHAYLSRWNSDLCPTLT